MYKRQGNGSNQDGSSHRFNSEQPANAHERDSTQHGGDDEEEQQQQRPRHNAVVTRDTNSTKRRKVAMNITQLDPVARMSAASSLTSERDVPPPKQLFVMNTPASNSKNKGTNSSAPPATSGLVGSNMDDLQNRIADSVAGDGVAPACGDATQYLQWRQQQGNTMTFEEENRTVQRYVRDTLFPKVKFITNDNKLVYKGKWIAKRNSGVLCTTCMLTLVQPN